MSEQFIKEVYEGVINRDAGGTVASAQKALDAGANPLEIIERGLTKGMETVGEKFEMQEFFLPHLLLATNCVKAAMKVLNPFIKTTGDTKTMVIGTVEGDIHDIGKNLVALTMEAVGFKVIDLGVSVKSSDYIAAVKKHKPNLLGLSALITSTMINMEKTIKELEKEGLRDQVKVIVGGAPVDAKYAKSIGADYYGKTVSAAITVGKELKGAK
ncbi:MAG: corrinoid protein [Synergistaceae bacterium]|jgi:5-methyltetrahydrofolate--homocysteine methyltransferase|nr:corrinoid protein [Synergistaceae bacterium]